MQEREMRRHHKERIEVLPLRHQELGTKPRVLTNCALCLRRSSLIDRSSEVHALWRSRLIICGSTGNLLTMLFDICHSLPDDGFSTVITIRFVCYYECQKRTFHQVHSPSNVCVLHGEGPEEYTVLQGIRRTICCYIHCGHVKFYPLPGFSIRNTQFSGLSSKRRHPCFVIVSSWICRLMLSSSNSRCK